MCAPCYIGSVMACRAIARSHRASHALVHDVQAISDGREGGSREMAGIARGGRWNMVCRLARRADAVMAGGALSGHGIGVGIAGR